MPTVSVITPVYNGERYLRAALDSLLAQTYPDWELVIVDDGSTDGTPDILASYSDRRIVKLRQPNSGEAAARNAGLANAHGEYIAFLDADDLYLPTALADFTAFMDTHPQIDAVFSDGYFCDESDQRLMRLSEHRPGIYTGHILEPLVLSPSVITVPVCTMTRRAAIEREQLQFDQQLVIGPDWDFWIRLARYARFAYLDKLTCMYRIHSTNIQRTSGQQKRLNDLAYGRMKVLNAEWFPTLSLPTRRQFLSEFLTTILVDQPARQQAVLEHGRVHDLPADDQALLWRQVGISYLLDHTEPDFALKCLRQCVQLQPTDRKGRAVLMAVRIGGISAARAVLQGWQLLININHRIRAIGKPQPKPVPGSLQPIGK